MGEGVGEEEGVGEGEGVTEVMLSVGGLYTPVVNSDILKKTSWKHRTSMIYTHLRYNVQGEEVGK